MPICRLQPLLVNQIAAGEVIERPASVAKELIENAIDAAAGRIDVAIEQGGKELVRVIDDGCGIPAAELPLALAPHATSKIATAADLDAIATMGFRGEALASMASVSRISLLSRTAADDGAALIEGEGDDLQPPRPAPGPVGTNVTVRNLFFNTPARRKFLRTDRTEGGRVIEIVQNLALAHPSIAFTLTVDGQVRLDLPPDQAARERVLSVVGEELAGELLEVAADERGIGIWGLAGTPNLARATARHQRVYLNGRMIADRSINHAIKEAYRGLIEPTRSPMIVLFLEMDPSLVDVNVHPSKAEVRFRNQASVHGAVLSAVRAALRKADLTPGFDLGRTGTDATGAMAAPRPQPAEFGRGAPGPAPGSSAPAPGGEDAPRTGSSDAGAPSAASFVEYFRRLDPKQKGFVYGEMKEALARETPEILEEEIAARAGSPDASDPENGPGPISGASSGASSGGGAMPTVRQAINALQVHSSFIVTQDEQGIVIIDQHALHERVIFEKLRRRLESGPLESQRLLMPATVEVDGRQVEALDELRPLLKKLGIEAELMGPKTIAIHAFTSLQFERGVDPVSFMQELLARAVGDGLGDDPEAALHEVLDMMACKAAIKAGDRLRPAEIEELLAYRETIERSSNCPHGRPTSLRLSIRDLERQFGRR
ncbi:MAG: DNA mismatch repair endonuclease MutL [Planctomycetota bacterium]|nr:DNA mismatch repair endonuclease MutL [Planctomycetota bacterium]